MAQLLLQKRAKADIPDNEGWTPLSVAAEDGYATRGASSHGFRGRL